MRFPPGVDASKAIDGYHHALRGFPAEAIAVGIGKFLRGECSDVSPKFCPHPPELAAIVRGVVSPELSGKKYFSYKQPESRLLERSVTRDYARRLVDNGVYPRGSIWVPGDVDGDRPDIGSLFAPDPKWKHPVSVIPKEWEPTQETPGQRTRMKFKMAVLSAAVGITGGPDALAQANDAGLEAMIALGQRWHVAVPEELFAQLKGAA